MTIRSWVFWVVGGFALFGSFFLTLWLTEPSPPQSGVAGKWPILQGASDWTTGASRLIEGAAAAPDGTNSAVQFVEGTEANAYHFLAQNISDPSPPAGSYTLTVYIKGNGRDVLLRAHDENGGSIFAASLNTGATILSGPYGSGFTLETVSTASAADGFWRLQMTFTRSKSTALAIQLEPILAGTTTAVYTGNGTGGFYWWRVELRTGK